VSASRWASCPSAQRYRRPSATERKPTDQHKRSFVVLPRLSFERGPPFFFPRLNGCFIALGCCVDGHVHALRETTTAACIGTVGAHAERLSDHLSHVLWSRPILNARTIPLRVPAGLGQAPTVLGSGMRICLEVGDAARLRLPGLSLL